MKKYLLLLISIFFGYLSHAQLNMQFRSQLTYPGLALANIWGYVDTLGNEYALVGTSAGVSIVNITNPANPVQVFTVTGTTSQWREIKTWGKYAYVTTEGCCNGLQIINLSNLPASVSSSYWTGNGAIAGQLQRLHSLHIEDGYIYLNGSNLFNGACIIASLANPVNPTYLSNTALNFTGTTRYVHDCYVRNDTMYGANIYAGMFTVINVSNKSNPVLINTQNTPNNFTHNCWLSDDGRKLFTTDETSNSFLTAYDISNPGNITYLDKVQSNPGSNVIVHNTYIKNDYAVTSWYKDGVSIVDASRPDNLIIVANYDTYTQGTGSGFNGCWGVYPYLPSGNIVASDINNGLFVLTPTYVRACYLEGNIVNSCNGVAISGVTVQISGGNSDISVVTGNYKTGSPTAGSYTVTFSKSGYFTSAFQNVTLTNGNVTTLNVSLIPLTAVTSISAVVTNNTCNGQQNGTIALSTAGGTMPLSYQWSNGMSTSSNSNLAAGTYTVTVTDAAGCSLTKTANVTEPPPLNPAPVSNSPLCNNTTLNLSSASGFASYLWSGPNGYTASGQNNSISNITASGSGTYSVSVTDNNGCSGSMSVNVSVSSIAVNSVVNNVTCFNTPTASIDITPNGGIGNLTYLWNNSAITQDLNNIKAGTYTVTVTDGIGCSKTTSYQVTQAAANLTLSSAKTNIRCNGINTGTITVNPAGGIAPYNYSWNTNPVSTSQTITSLSAGSYIATVTDAAGCIKSVTVSITQPPAFIVTTSQSNVAFPGGSDGTAIVYPSGGTPPYTYLWNTFPAQSNASVSGLTAGFYKCRVTDAKSCVKNVGFTITEPFSIKNNSSQGSGFYPVVYPNPSHEFISLKYLDKNINYVLTLTDVAGRIIQIQKTTHVQQTAIPLTGIQGGIYFLKIEGDNQTQVVKITIQ